jgi:prepilin-type N-terminal cleavage/methylation domain-containing protein
MIRSLRPHAPRDRGGFTLVEMLVTVTIVAILAAAVFGAMAAAQNTAKIAKTRTTIAKLHRLIMARYESYKTRRIPIDMTFQVGTTNYITTPLTPQEMAMVRLEAIREIMRIEMPDRAADVVNLPTSGAVGSFSSSGWAKLSRDASLRKMQRTSISDAYYIYWQQQESQGRRWREDAANTYTSAECLYMIVTMACPGGREQFAENEIDDVDHDGWPEFVDGWGRPIFFCRWAPGFIPANGADTVLQSGNPTLQHDPFDTQKVDSAAYQLIPLIYSAGPDNESHIVVLNASKYSSWLSSGARTPYTLKDANNRLQGQPGDYDKPGSTALKHFDNIHNHRLDVR